MAGIQSYGAYIPIHRLARAEIAKSWGLRPRVRQALVLNPGSPPAVSVPLLTLMGRPELAEVLVATDVPPVVRATARELWEFRPPQEPRSRSALPH